MLTNDRRGPPPLSELLPPPLRRPGVLPHHRRLEEKQVSEGAHMPVTIWRMRFEKANLAESS